MYRDLNVFRGVFDTVGIGMSVVDYDGNILWVSRGLCNILGVEPEDLMSKPAEEYVEEDLRGDLEEQKEDLAALREVWGTDACVELQRLFYHKQTDKPVWLSMTVQFGEYQGQPAGLVVSTEVTKLVERNQELERANEDLERFAYIASHDLKQPLRMIAGFVELLGSRYEAQLDSQGRGWIHRVSENARQASVMVEDLLAFSRAGRILEGAQRVNARYIVERSRDQALAGEGPAVVEIFEEEVLFKVVPSHFESLFTNLISNASKFRSPDRPLHVEVGHQHGNTEDTFWVRDNGKGISNDMQEKLFEPFKYHHPDGESGSGIGLAICDRVVKFYKGRIEVESEVGVGTTFYIRLPKDIFAYD